MRINCISPGQIDVGVDLHNVGALLSLFILHTNELGSSICEV